MLSRLQTARGLGASKRLLWLTVIGLGLATPANADWLATVWPNTTNSKTGNPAITLSADAVYVVLPEPVLAEAVAAGLTLEGAVGAFLGRYAPKMCSSLLDMSAVHSHLKVELRVQRSAAMRSLDTSTQEDAAVTLNEALKRQEQTLRTLPHLEKAFVVDRQGLTLSIDYVPEKTTKCVVPPDVVF
jgi:hypothetical protein